MPIVTSKDIHISFGSKVIFDKLELQLYPGEKVGLVGPNGCGKTTLLNIIHGTVEPDIGETKKSKNLKIGYLTQEPNFRDDKTVLEELHAGAEAILALQRKLEASAGNISRASSGESKAAMRQYERLSAEFELAGGYEYETRIKEITAGIGLDERYYRLKTSQLSGGELSRLGLAKVLLSSANLLLLDEPTNHLDWEATVWLERFLKNYKGAAVIVSHDRFLLDRLVCKIIEISDRKAAVFSGNYSTYKCEKEKQNLELQRRYQKRLKFVEKTRDFIARNKDQEGMRKVARGRKKRLNRTLHQDADFLERPKQEKELNFKFAEVENKAKRIDTILGCEKLTKQFDSVRLFEDLSFELFRGERLGIIGPNGVGKTTLLKLALRQIEPSSGKIEFKKNLSTGYLDQAGAELNPDNSVLEEASLATAGDLSSENLRSRLGAFLFSGDDVFKKVGDLSGGERSRLALCKLVLAEPEVLVLDEPTNHLDIPSTEALENALQNYKGTIIAVSHDRFFLDKVVNKLLVLGTDEFGKKAVGRFELIEGPFSRYAELLEERAGSQNEKEKGSKAAKPKRPKRQKQKKTTPPELRQFNGWSIERIEDAIFETEEQLESLHERFGDEKTYKTPRLLAELQKEFEEKQQHLNLLYQAHEWRTS